MRHLSYIELPLTEDPRQVFTTDLTIDGTAFHARIELRHLSAPDQWVISIWDNASSELLVNQIPLISSGANLVNDLLLPFRYLRNGAGIGSLFVLRNTDDTSFQNLCQTHPSSAPSPSPPMASRCPYPAASVSGDRILATGDHQMSSLRGQSFLGRAADSVTSALSAVHSRPMLTPFGLMVIPPEGLPEAVRVTEKDLLDTPAFVSGGSLMILSAMVVGWRPGQTVDVSYKNIHARGIIIARGVDADTASGPWKSELLVEVLKP